MKILLPISRFESNRTNTARIPSLTSHCYKVLTRCPTIVAELQSQLSLVNNISIQNEHLLWSSG